MPRLVATVLVIVACLASSASQAQRLPRVRVEEPTVGPADSPRTYRRVLLRARDALQRCVVLPRASRPYIVRFDVLVHPDGRMQLLGAQIPLHATRADSHACLTEAIATLRGPTPRGGASLRVGIPVLFRKTS